MPRLEPLVKAHRAATHAAKRRVKNFEDAARAVGEVADPPRALGFALDRERRELLNVILSLLNLAESDEGRGAIPIRFPGSLTEADRAKLRAQAVETLEAGQSVISASGASIAEAVDWCEERGLGYKILALPKGPYALAVTKPDADISLPGAYRDLQSGACGRVRIASPCVGDPLVATMHSADGTEREVNLGLLRRIV